MCGSRVLMLVVARHRQICASGTIQRKAWCPRISPECESGPDWMAKFMNLLDVGVEVALAATIRFGTVIRDCDVTNGWPVAWRSSTRWRSANMPSDRCQECRRPAAD